MLIEMGPGHFDEVLKGCQDLLDRRYEINRHRGEAADKFMTLFNIWLRDVERHFGPFGAHLGCAASANPGGASFEKVAKVFQRMASVYEKQFKRGPKGSERLERSGCKV